MNLKTWWQHCWLPACLLLVAITHTVSSETRVVCYYTNWSVYRPGTAKFSPQNINPYLCTHLIYAFGGFTKENSLKPFDKYQDIEKGGYAKFTGLKTYNKNLKTMLAIGGWNEGSSRFSPMVASADRRKELVKNTIKFLRQNHFDGLDLDWEYPSFRDGGKTRDKDNYANLVQELREEFDRETRKTGRPRLLLTMAVPAGIEYINKGYDIPKLNKYLDWMNILSYDYHSAFEPAVNHHSPLYPMEEDDEYNFDGDLNIDHTIKHYIKMGADSSKLVLGIPTYGRSYTLFNPDANELGAPADGPGDMGDATRENGYLAFYEICENLKENDWSVVQPNPEAMGPYAYKDNQWVSYDDELIVKKKAVYVVEHKLGGIMFWSIDNDDFRGNCYNKPYPLIEAAKEALITAASSRTEDNLVKPRKPISRPRRPTTSLKNDYDSTPSKVQNSGGRQSLNDAPSSSGRKRIRPSSRSKTRSDDTILERKDDKKESSKRIRPRGQRRRKTTTTTQSTTVTSTTPSTLPTTPMYRTPEPPTTPDPGGDFKCEEDGFFPHPRDCKKYFWCLSGPADLGIIAHQFTCPAGLYFNKAADSCDYTQNVLCNKKLKTTTTTTPATTSTTTTTPAPTTTTRRPRITAATSRTTFLYTSTTTTEEPEYYDEYEYEDDEDFNEDAPRRGEPDSEEDPRVIKELIDLIRKVGGVEELEKYLKLQDDGSMAVTQGGSTTPASISRSLYERVLQSRANAAKTNTVATTKSRNSLVYSSINRNKPSSQNEGLENPETVSESTVKRGNSRFTPQNEGLEKPETSKDASKRGRPQYTTINRQRPSTERTAESENESEDEEIDEEDDDEVQTKKTRQFPSRKQTTPEYVTIRRTRPTTVTEPEIEDEEVPTRSSIIRNRHRGIPGETDEEDSGSTPRPEYVTIRRNKPATEEVTTSKYTTLQRNRPLIDSSDNAETTTDIEFSKRRSTTQSPEEDSLEKDKRIRSTTLATTEETSILTTVNSDTTLEDSKKTTTEKEATTTENSEVKSTLEEATDATAEKSATQTPITELPLSSSELAQSTTLEASTEVPSNQINDTTSEKNSPSPQLFRPRPFATRTRSTTAKPSSEATEAPAKKVSESQGIKPGVSGRPIVRKFQPGNRFVARPQAQSTQSSVDINDRVSDRTTTEENSIGTQEDNSKQREEEFRRRIGNRGRSKFTLPTSTFQPTVARRRRPQTVTSDYEYADYEEVQRTYRPTLLADLSSLTSADIAFQRGNNRKHIRRRPTTQSTISTTITEAPTESGLKTGPKTLTIARKVIYESTFGRNSRRTLPTQNQRPTDSSTTESNTFNVASTKSSLFGKPRPAFASLLRTTTTKKSTTSTETVEAETTTVTFRQRSKFSEAPPLVRTTAEITTENNIEVTETTFLNSALTEQHLDSTESNSDNEYKTITLENDASNNEVTEVPEAEATIYSTSEVQEHSPITKSTRLRSTTVASIDDTTTVLPITERTLIRRIRPITTQTFSSTTTSIPEVPKINRTRKVFIANRRIRLTTPISTEVESSNTETIRTTVDFKRQRPSFLTLRNNQSTNRLNITRLRPIKDENDELEINSTSETNRGIVKRIRPIGIGSKIDEEEKIKLSETNISENGYLGAVQNLPEDDSGKIRRRKIVRRIRPSKDFIFSKSEEEEQKSRRVKINNKSFLPKEEEISDEDETLRIQGRGRFLTTTLKEDLETETEPESETETNKKIKPSKDTLFSKSESIDILRSKRIRLNDKIETETEINNERDDEEYKTKRINNDDESTEGLNFNISTTDSDLEHTETETEDSTRRRPTSSLYKSSNDFRNRRLKLKLEPEDDGDKKVTTTAETPSTFRPRNLIRKLRPGFNETNSGEPKIKVNSENIKFVENNRAFNRTRKIIRRLRPTTTTTTEVDIPQSTITEASSISTTAESNIYPTSENIFTTDFIEEEILPTTEPIIETTEYAMTTLEDTEETTFFTTEAETTTTTTTTPRPTRPSLIGRSRPAYRPRNRPLIEIRSTTPGILPPNTFRRKFGGLNKNESTVEREETEDGIIDNKLKKLYSKKQKYTPNVRSTTERQKDLKEEEEEEKVADEENNSIATTTTDNASDKISTEKELETTVNDLTEAAEIVTTDGSVDMTTIPEETEISTIFSTEPSTTINENKQSETTTLSQSTTETEIKSTTVTKTTETSTLDTTSEGATETEEITTTEINRDFDENLTTEYIAETTIPDEISENSISQSTTDSSTQETSTSETTTNLESTSNEPSTTENENRQESERPRKPIRYRPSDRPKLRINLNRTETDNDKTDNDEPKNRKFIPSKTIDQRNRNKLAYRKDSSTEKPKEVFERTFIPKGRKLERPGLQQNLNVDYDEDDKEEGEEKLIEDDKGIEEEKEKVIESKPERGHYPTLKPVSEIKEDIEEERDDIIEYKPERAFYPTLRPVSKFYQNEDEDDDDDEEFEGEVTDEEEPPIENPLIKYIQTIRNNQDVIKTIDHQEEDADEDYPEEQPPPAEEAVEEEYDGEEEEGEQNEEETPKDESTKFNIPIVNRPTINRPPVQTNVPSRVANRPQYTPNRPAVINEPRRPAISTGNRPFNPNEASRPEPNRSVQINRPVEVDTYVEPTRAPANRPNSGRNYPRRFNKPANPTSTSTTTESLTGINIEAVNARNKNLYSKNRKANIPHPGPTSTTVNDTISTTTTTIETTTPKIEISQVTEEIILSEPTTEQLSTLHHIFAEPDVPTTPITSSAEVTTGLSTENTTKYNFTAAQIEAARSLERVIEVNRIVEVSLKEDKVINSTGAIETRVMLEKVPTLHRIGAINRVTVIKIVDGGNETFSSIPSNHAVTLNEIVTGKRIDTSQKIDIVAKLHAPDINLTKMNILNNTLEIIETQRRGDTSKEITTENILQATDLPQIVTVTEITEGEKIPEGIPVHIVNGPKILDQLINDTVVVSSSEGENKFEINSKSNVIDYSHRELDPNQVIASAQPANLEQAKQGRKLAIDSKSVVVNNYNVRPIFSEATTLPLEALFQTDSPDYNLLREGTVTQLPTLKEVVTARGNYVDDDQDLLESRNINGRVRIRILGQDDEFSQYEQSKDPVFAPIRVLNQEEEKAFTLKADVIEVTSKPKVETIKIAPIEVSLSQPQTVRVPIVRVESSQSSSAERRTQIRHPSLKSLKRESPTYFNPEIIFGDTSKTDPTS